MGKLTYQDDKEVGTLEISVDVETGLTIGYMGQTVRGIGPRMATQLMEQLENILRHGPRLNS